MAFPHSDDFNRADSTTLGGVWLELVGDWSIVSNECKNITASDADASLIALHDKVADIRATVTLRSASPGVGGIYGRLDTNYILSYYDSGLGTVGAFDVVSGTPTSLGTASVSFAQGDTFALQLKGTSLIIYKNGTSVFTATTSVTSTGYSGLFASTTNELFDNWSSAYPIDTGSGALAAQAASVSGSGTSASTGSGALSAQAAAVSGSGTSASTGTGALAAQAAAVSGAGTSASTGSGDLVAQAAAVAGTGTSESTGSGALEAQAATVAGEGVSGSTGTGALEAQSASVEGAGVSESTGTGALEAGDAGVSGEGVVTGGGARFTGGWPTGGIAEVLEEGRRQRERARREREEEERVEREAVVEARKVIERVALAVIEQAVDDQYALLMRELARANLAYREWYAEVLADKVFRERLRREQDDENERMMMLM